MSDFLEKLAKRTEEADQMIRPFLPEETGYQKTICRAVNYSVRAGGKRIRPILMDEVCDMCGGTDVAALGPFMAALEMIHTYSLVHDDLPAMDNDDYRRGKETTHKKFGEAMGILAGDGLLNLAFETGLRAFDSGVDYNCVVAALKVLAYKSGIYGMVGGQSIDIESNGGFVDESTLLYLYRTKTAALFEAAFVIGGILADVSGDDAKYLRRAGRNVGLAFQIQDDILDMVGEADKLGKPIHSDEQNQKSTFASIYGIEVSKKKVKTYTEEALSDLEQFGGASEFLTELITWMVDRDI